MVSASLATLPPGAPPDPNSDTRLLPMAEALEARTAILHPARFMARLTEAARSAADPMTMREAVTPVLAATLAEGRTEIRRRFERRSGEDRGAQCLAEHTHLMDQLLTGLFRLVTGTVFPVANPTTSEQLALVALGGYGRREMAPHSDIDLLFLHPYKPTPRSEQVTEFILYCLWDLGLQVGHAVRSIEESLRRAKEDMTIRTTILESRYITGDRALFQELCQRFDKDIRRHQRGSFVDAKLSEREDRHRRTGDSRYVLEPNIKDGKGGLRDLHTLFWIGRYIYGVSRIGELIGKGVLSEEECATFRHAQAFLWTVRCMLHYVTGRSENRLTFDVQPTMAAALGYTEHAGSAAVERFMKHYFLIAKDVGDLTRIICAAVEAELSGSTTLARFTQSLRQREVDGFVVSGGRLAVQDENQFRKTPVDMLRLFRVAQKGGYDIEPATLRLLRASLPKVGPKFRQREDANALFLEILTAKENPEPTLRRMSEAGLLGRFVPEFGRVIAQMQFDMYHVYTTDEHTLQAIGILHRIEARQMKEEMLLAHRLMKGVDSRRALYVGLFLHDIAKGRGGNHAGKGEAIARRLAARFGLDEAETETAAWLVRHHLVMSHTAQKTDLEDADIVRGFADFVQSLERLRLLTILTCCDISAVGPGTFTAWKNGLLTRLYERTEEMLNGGWIAEKRDRRIESRRQHARTHLADWSDADFGWLTDTVGAGFWLGFEPEVAARHARTIRSAARESRDLAVTMTADSEREATEIAICTPDRPGLFAALASALALCGASILDARIATLENGLAFDVFWVTGAEGGDFTRPDRRARLASTLARTVDGSLDAVAKARTQEPATHRRLPAVLETAPRVFINNTASQSFSIVEINATDRPGLLGAITGAFASQGLRIAYARVSTFGAKAVDTFYVKDCFGLQIQHPTKQRALRRAIVDAIVPIQADHPSNPASSKAA